MSHITLSLNAVFVQSSTTVQLNASSINDAFLTWDTHTWIKKKHFCAFVCPVVVSMFCCVPFAKQHWMAFFYVCDTSVCVCRKLESEIDYAYRCIDVCRLDSFSFFSTRHGKVSMYAFVMSLTHKPKTSSYCYSIGIDWIAYHSSSIQCNKFGSCTLAQNSIGSPRSNRNANETNWMWNIHHVISLFLVCVCERERAERAA